MMGMSEFHFPQNVDVTVVDATKGNRIVDHLPLSRSKVLFPPQFVY